ncbi:MAG: hypothetical protein H2049_06165 [Porphyrobacter sp.]|nr:hypothetical protein [Porphyrobacter sp.]
MKDAALRLLMAAGWTVVLPLIGFQVFGILTIIPLFGLFLGLKLLPFIYAAGAAPAFVTAAAFELLFRRWGLARSLFATTALGAMSSVLWMTGLLYISSGRDEAPFNYMYFALAISGAFSAALMPLTRFAKDRRRWR